MIEREPNERELAFLSELDRYVNRWVAILGYGSEERVIVASGASIKEARKEAESKGFTEITFFKVPPTDSLFLPIASVNET